MERQSASGARQSEGRRQTHARLHVLPEKRESRESLSLFNCHEPHIENQSCVRGNRPSGRSVDAVSQIRRNTKLAPATNLHASNAFIPAFNDLVVAERKFEWLGSDRAVEFLAIREPARVVDLDLLARFGDSSRALPNIPVFQA